MHSATVWRFTPLAMATGLSLMPLAASKRMAAGSTCRFSALRDRRRSSSLSRSAADRLNGCRFVTNGINHSATQMFLLGSFQQNANLERTGGRSVEFAAGREWNDETNQFQKRS